MNRFDALQGLEETARGVSSDWSPLSSPWRLPKKHLIRTFSADNLASVAVPLQQLKDFQRELHQWIDLSVSTGEECLDSKAVEIGDGDLVVDLQVKSKRRRGRPKKAETQQLQVPLTSASYSLRSNVRSS